VFEALKEEEEGRGGVLSTVQNREERPAARNGGAVSSSSSSSILSAQEANDFSRWSKSGRAGPTIAVQRAPSVSSFSLSLPLLC